MAYVQKTTIVGNSGSTATATFGAPITAANGIIAVVVQSGTGAGRTYTLTNGVDTFLTALSYSPSRAVHVFWVPGSVGGVTTLQASVISGTAAFDLEAFEVLPLDGGVAPSTSTFANAASLTHYCAAVEGIATDGASFIVTGSALAANVSGQTKNADFDGGSAGTGNSRYFQWYDRLTAISGARGEWTQTGTAQNSTSAIAAFAYASQPPAPSSTGAVQIYWFGR
jgi:hypothetical protein